MRTTIIIGVAAALATSLSAQAAGLDTIKEGAARTSALVESKLKAGTAKLQPLATNLEFLPEIERVLSGNGGLGQRIYLSFEQGTVSTESRAENAQLNRQLHRDLKLDLTDGMEQWTGVDLLAAPAADADWSRTPAELIRDLGDNLAPPLATMQITPGIWFFKTRDGNYGLMKILNALEKTNGMKSMRLVYKLAGETRPAKNISLGVPLSERLKQLMAGEKATIGYNLEIWQANPNGNMTLRPDLRTITLHDGDTSSRINEMGHIYDLRSADRYYLQWDGLGASTMHYYGPFSGDPVKQLGLPTGTNEVSVRGN